MSGERIVFRDVSKFYGEVLGVNRVNLEIRGAYDGLVSDATFLQLRANAKLIHRQFSGQHLPRVEDGQQGARAG